MGQFRLFRAAIRHGARTAWGTALLVSGLLLVAIVCPVSALADTHVSGIVSANTTWSAAQSPYLIDGEVQVSYGVTLTIDPGVEVKGGMLSTWGQLNAAGTADNPVYFNGVVIAPGSNTSASPYAINLSHCMVDCRSSGSLYTAGGNAVYGSLSVRDSVIVDAPFMYLWYPISDSYVERNVFKGCAGIITLTHDDPSATNVYIRNNAFYDSVKPIENHASYRGTKTVVEGNTFMQPASATNHIAMKLTPGYSDAVLDGRGNYWDTTSASEIAARIYDKTDDLNCSGYILFEPFLAAPDPATPVLQTPAIATVTPSHGLVGSSVVIEGSRFTGVDTVTFNGTSASFTTDSTTQITVTVPVGATTGKVSIVGPTGTGTSAADFVITPPAPYVSGFAPTAAPIGTSVTISGTALTGTSEVRFNGTVASFTVDSATQIQATVPAGATSGPISVTTPGGTTTSSSFVVIPAPVITGFSPLSGRVGASVTISGSDLIGTSEVRFNGTVASFTVDSATQITATVPAGATTGKVTVTTPAGSAASAANFTVIPAPSITSFTPTSGPVGTAVTLTGSGFTGATAVAFNGTAATFSVNSSTQITATVPAGATTGKVTVTTPAGSAASAASFTVTASVVSPKLTLKLSGLKGGSIKLGRRVTAKGTVAPTSLAGGKVTLTVQKKKGAKWVKAKTASAKISTKGAYSWTYKPAKKGTYRVRTTIAKTATNTAATTAWRGFKVK